MSDDTPELPAEAPWPPQALVTSADFRSVDFNAVVRDVSSVYDHTLETAFMKAAQENREKEPHFSVYRLLASACGLHFRLHDKASAFGAKMVLGNGRTPIPEDWLGAQTDAMFEVLEEIKHPAVRARIADVVWTNDRKKGKAAQIAVVAYCECVEGLAKGNFENRFATENDVSREEVDLIERATQIHARSNKKGSAMHDRVAALLNHLYERAMTDVDVVSLNRLATLLSRYSLINMDDLSAHMEQAALAAEQKLGAYPLAIKELWDTAAFAHEKAGRSDEQRRCQLAGVEQTLKMSLQTGSSSAAAHWYRQAIGELRDISGTQEQREKLRKEMRTLQEKSLEEMGAFTIPIDLSDIVTGTIEVFERLTLPDGLRQFALLVQPSKAEDMRKQAIDTEVGIAGMFSATHLDGEGKIVAEVEGMPLDGSIPSEDWLKSKMIQQIQFTVDIAVRGQLEPARRFLSGEFPLSERHFQFIVLRSPFVPRSHAATFALGFARLMQGDLLSAGHLLIPQLEHCLRYVLVNSGTDTSKMRNDLTQEDRSLSTLLELYHADLIRIFGEDNVLHLDLLFNHRPGPALRHEFAHGKVGDQSYGSPAIFYACCFIYMLTCIPLMHVWAEHVAPAIEEGSF